MNRHYYVSRSFGEICDCLVQEQSVLQLLETQGYRERDNGMNSSRFSSVDRYLRVSNGYRKSRLFLEFQLSGKSFAIINIGWILLAIFVSRTGKATTNSNTAENIVEFNQRLYRSTYLPTIWSIGWNLNKYRSHHQTQTISWTIFEDFTSCDCVSTKAVKTIHRFTLLFAALLLDITHTSI